MPVNFVNLFRKALNDNMGTLLAGIGSTAFFAGLTAPTAAPNTAPTAAPTTAPTIAPTPPVAEGAQAPDPAPIGLEEKKIEAQQALEEAKKSYDIAFASVFTTMENEGEGDVLTDEADALFEANSNLVEAFQNLMIIAQEEYNSAHEMRDLALEYLSVLNYVGEETETEETNAEAAENNLDAAMVNLEDLRIDLAEITAEEEETHTREALSSPVLCGAFSDLPRVVVTTRTENETTAEDIVACAPAPADLEEKKIEAQQALKESKKSYEIAFEAVFTAMEKAFEAEITAVENAVEVDITVEKAKEEARTAIKNAKEADEVKRQFKKLQEANKNLQEALQRVIEITQEENDEAEMENLEGLRINLAEITKTENATAEDMQIDFDISLNLHGVVSEGSAAS